MRPLCPPNARNDAKASSNGTSSAPLPNERCKFSPHQATNRPSSPPRPMTYELNIARRTRTTPTNSRRKRGVPIRSGGEDRSPCQIVVSRRATPEGKLVPREPADAPRLRAVVAMSQACLSGPSRVGPARVQREPDVRSLCTSIQAHGEVVLLSLTMSVICAQRMRTRQGVCTLPRIQGLR